MGNAALVIQKAIRRRLVNDSTVLTLVPAASVLDRNERPAPDPSIILGEDQVVDAGAVIDRSVWRIHSTLHTWKTEAGLTGVKEIAGAISVALGNRRLELDDGFVCVDLRVTDSRFLRDPEGQFAHGIVIIETLVREPA